MQDPVFGNSNAELDELLYQCPVNHVSPDAQKPILTGRWGTGKTALVLLDGKEISSLLRLSGNDNDRLWYLKEQSLDLTGLLSIEQQLANNTALLRRTFESAWRGEIIRTYCRVLQALSGRYKAARGSHWVFVESVGKIGVPTVPIWKQLGKVVTILSGSAESGKATDAIQDAVSAVLQYQAVENVRRCLLDIGAHAGEPIPIIAIEPIETPTSKIEENTHLADELITSLLNVFHQSFQPTTANRVNVRITLPWHRYDPSRLDFPQKLRQYIGHVRWTRSSLREFINKRIEWEFRRVGRRFVARPGRDAWLELFGEKIVNGVCRPRVLEDSFDYFLRHTHHRARDLQHLARRAIERQADELDCSLEDVLRRSQPVSNTVIKEMFRSEGPVATEELIIEAARRFPQIMQVKEHLRGLAIPFGVDDLRKRMINAGVDLNFALEILWNAGVMGVTAVPETPQAAEMIMSFLPDDSRRSYVNDAGERLDRWCWFEYNYRGNAATLLDKLTGIKDVRGGLILHSKTLEYFAPHSIDTTIPIGI